MQMSIEILNSCSSTILLAVSSLGDFAIMFGWDCKGFQCDDNGIPPQVLSVCIFCCFICLSHSGIRFQALFRLMLLIPLCFIFCSNSFLLGSCFFQIET